MADSFIGEIRIFSFNYPPKNWAVCDGAILQITQQPALFSLLGPIYGGDGKQTFALPNLQGMAPMHWGQASGLTHYAIGQQGGSDTVALDESQMTSHTHALETYMGTSNSSNVPTGNLFEAVDSSTPMYGPPNDLAPMAAGSLANAGESQAHNNLQPYLPLYFCICTYGIFPSRW